jgi:hypothetical protein
MRRSTPTAWSDFGDTLKRQRAPNPPGVSCTFFELIRLKKCGRTSGHWVELRVLRTAEVPSLAAYHESDVKLDPLGTAEVPSLAAYHESDVMLDPWVEFPQPKSKFSVIAEFGPAPLPDVPEIPNDEDGA